MGLRCRQTQPPYPGPTAYQQDSCGDGLPEAEGGKETQTTAMRRPEAMSGLVFCPLSFSIRKEWAGLSVSPSLLSSCMLMRLVSQRMEEEIGRGDRRDWRRVRLALQKGAVLH